MCNAIFRELERKCANAVIKLGDFDTAKNEGRFTCAVGTTHNIRSCHHCLWYNRQPAALDNETLFQANRVATECDPHVFSLWEGSSIVVVKALSLYGFGGKDIPSFPTLHGKWIPVFRSANIDFVLFVTSSRTFCFGQYKVQNTPPPLLSWNHSRPFILKADMNPDRVQRMGPLWPADVMWCCRQLLTRQRRSAASTSEVAPCSVVRLLKQHPLSNGRVEYFISVGPATASETHEWGKKPKQQIERGSRASSPSLSRCSTT